MPASSTKTLHEHVRTLRGATRSVLAMPSDDVLLSMLNAGLDAGGRTDCPETRGDAGDQVLAAAAVVQVIDEARRVLGLVMGGGPIVFSAWRMESCKASAPIASELAATRNAEGSGGA